MMNLGHCHLLFGCHVTDSDMAPGFHVREKKRGGSELSHLGMSSPVSIHRCWPSFVSNGVLHVHSWVFFAVLVVVAVSDTAFPCCCWLGCQWVFAMVVGGPWRL